MILNWGDIWALKHLVYKLYGIQLCNEHHCVSVQDHSERQWLLPLSSYSGDSEWDDAGVWRKHAQRHIHESRRQVLLLWLLGLQLGSVTHTCTQVLLQSALPASALPYASSFFCSLHWASSHSYICRCSGRRSGQPMCVLLTLRSSSGETGGQMLQLISCSCTTWLLRAREVFVLVARGFKLWAENLSAFQLWGCWLLKKLT